MPRLALLSLLLVAGPAASAPPAATPDAGTPAATPRFRWDVPAQLDTVEVPGLVTAMGVPMKLHAVRSKWRLLDLFHHFEAAFARAGLYVPPRGHVQLPVRDPFVTGVDPVRKVSFTVILQANADGTTTCILGEAHLGERKGPSSSIAPVHPAAEQPLESDVEGLRTLVYRVRAGAQEVAAFYRETLPRAGYTEQQPGLFVRGQMQLDVQYQPGEDGGGTVLIVESPHRPDALEVPR